MAPHPDLQLAVRWLEQHPGVFAWSEQKGSLALFERTSGKGRVVASSEIERVLERQNRLDEAERYVILLLVDGLQLVLARQGFVFAPSFVNTGPLALPSPVFCMRDFTTLFEQLRHLPAERKKDALDLIMALIAIADGAAAVGLDVERESRQLEQVLARVERGEAPDPRHGIG